MRRAKYRVTLIFAGLILMLTGCSTANAANPKVSLAVIAGVHSNSPVLPLSSETIYQTLYQVSYTYGDISFINCDANPQVYFQTSIPIPEVSGLSEEKLHTIATEYTVQLQDILGSATANTNEVDTLKALHKAGQALKNSDGDKMLLVLDSGLSTSGYLDYTKGLLNATPSDVVDALAKASALPDLTNINVTWSFCGEVAAPQEELSEKQKQNLKKIWESILLAAGAKTVEFSTDFTTDMATVGMPSVSTVTVEPQDVDVIIEEPLDTAILSSANVQFIGDTADFINRQAAEASIKIVADELLIHPDSKMYVAGTTASGNDEYCKQLSKNRAEAVIDVLISFGVSADQLIPLGLGDDDPWHLNDLDESGHQIESIACQNRKVLIIDVNSGDAQKIN